MQRAKTTQLYHQDVKEAISSVKKREYRRALGEATTRKALAAIEHSVRTNFQLTQDDRLQLLGDVERIISLASPSGIDHEQP